MGSVKPPVLPTTQHRWRWLVNTGTTWLACVAAWAVCNYLGAAFHSGGRPAPTISAGTLSVAACWGLFSVWLMSRTGFPAGLDACVGWKRQMLYPVGIGMTFGVLAIALDLLTGASKVIVRVLGTELNVGFPASLFAYTGGAVAMEFQYRLLAVPLLLWIISGVLLRGRWQSGVYWLIAVLTSLAEPVLQGLPLYLLAKGAITPPALAAYMVHAYAFNLACAYMLRRGGLLSAVLVRWGNYLAWHVTWGAWLQYRAALG